MHLSDYMIAHNLDDEAVAAATNRSRVTISRIRRKICRPDWGTIAELKVFTGEQVTADDFQDINHPEAAA
jgi:hypothetical protein